MDNKEYVLIVDDNEDVWLLLTILINELGFEAATAADGEHALAQIAQQVPRLVLLDLMMPVMDGYDTYARIRANPATCAIPVIVITAIARSTIDFARLQGIRGVISKGHIDLLEHAIRKALESAVTPAEPPNRASSPESHTSSSAPKNPSDHTIFEPPQ